ncbi:MAG: ABC transporter permease, partial [Pseudomonadota bacterium]
MPAPPRGQTEAAAGPLTAADGRPLKQSLNRALRRQKLRALMLIAPLLIFVLVTFIAPIADMLFRSVENQIVQETIPETVAALADWDAETGEPPGEDLFLALYADMFLAAEQKTHTRLGTRLNYQMTGISSLFRKSGRAVDRFDTDIYGEQFAEANPPAADPATWVATFETSEARNALPVTAHRWERWSAFLTEVEGDDPAEEDIPDFLFTTLYTELAAGNLGQECT